MLLAISRETTKKITLKCVEKKRKEPKWFTKIYILNMKQGHQGVEEQEKI